MGILHVCTANRIRSPLAELMMRAILGSDYPIASAGTAAVAGEPIWPPAGVVLRDHAIDAGGFRSRPLTPDLVRASELVLTATRAHRDEIVAADPSSLGRVFTWRELAWLLEGVRPRDVAAQLDGRVGSERLRALVDVAGERRAHRPAPRPKDLDVRDPVGGPPRLMSRAMSQIRTATATIVRLL
jgi:protein-tyrosine phosphatase